MNKHIQNKHVVIGNRTHLHIANFCKHGMVNANNLINIMEYFHTFH